MRTLFGGIANASQGVLRVRSERLDRPQNLARTRSSGFVNLLRGKPLSSVGMDRYATDSTLFPIVNSLANDTSAVKFSLFAPGPTSQEEDRVEIMPGQHPAVDLWAKPNPFMSTEEFVESGQQHIDLVGEVIILVEFVGSVPVRLWPMSPHKFEPIKGAIIGAPGAAQFLLGWVYTADDGQQIPLDIKNIIQIKMPNPNDPWRGIGPVQAALVDLDSSRYSAEWNRMFFLNGATPEGIVQIEESFSDPEFTEFTERWRESHQGLNNAHRVAVLENGAVWVPNANTQRDMQFQELRAQSSDFIRKAFRYPKTMLGDTDSANRAVAEAGEYTYGKWLIEPRAKRWCAALNNRLMPLYGDNPRELYWDFAPVVESDDQVEAVTIKTRAEAATTLISSGVDAQDAFAVVGLPPMQWTKPEPKEMFGGEKGGDSAKPPSKSGTDTEKRKESGKSEARTG